MSGNIRHGAVVENKRLGAALAVIQAAQAERDRAKLASRTLTIREKDRVRATRSRAGAPPLEPRPDPKKADISTWAESGHLYLGLTPGLPGILVHRGPRRPERRLGLAGQSSYTGSPAA